jgi:hypothetical protein
MLMPADVSLIGLATDSVAPTLATLNAPLAASASRTLPVPLPMLLDEKVKVALVAAGPIMRSGVSFNPPSPARVITLDVLPEVLLTSDDVSFEFQMKFRIVMLRLESVICDGSVATLRLSNRIVFDAPGTPLLAQFTPELVVHDAGKLALSPSKRLIDEVL